MNDELQREIQSRIETFAKDITKLLQGAVNDALASVLANQGRSSSTATSSKGGAPRGRRGRKPAISEDVLLAEIKKQGGRRMEHLAKALGIPSIKLKGPIKRLVATKKVSTKGRRRGMTYTAK